MDRVLPIGRARRGLELVTVVTSHTHTVALRSLFTDKEKPHTMRCGASLLRQRRSFMKELCVCCNRGLHPLQRAG